MVLCSCGTKKDNPFKKLVIGNDFYYWESTAESTLRDAYANSEKFKKLEDKTENNLMKMFGKKPNYVWIRAEFEIPENFRNLSLGLVVPQLRSADQLYCNGAFISQYGAFPPNEYFTQFMSHFYSLPLSVLNQTGINTIFIKVFIHGNSGISSHAFIQPAFLAHPAYERLNFYHSRIYSLLFGVVIFTFVMYLCLYINLKDANFVIYRDFSLINFFSSLFLLYFCAMEIPIYSEGRIPFLIFAKFFFIIPGYIVAYLMVLFGTHFYGAKTSLWLKIVRNAIVLFQVVVTLFAPTYDFLLDISAFMMTLVGILLLSGIIELVIHIIKRKNRRRALVFILGLLPFILCAFVDIIIRIVNPTKSYPYFMLFGWIGTIVAFMIMLSIRFGFMYKNNERLTNHLQDEVEKQTVQLKNANAELSELNRQLDKAKKRSDMDLEMAFSVQKNFLPQPLKYFRGWEISVCYMPQAKVSGDLYDYYSFNDILNGLSLFDVSGHGLSAGLVTMLSKNIISRHFQYGFRNKEPVEKILSKINSTIIYEKGEIDNYMTGILCRFDNVEGTGKCRVEVGNAGHPCPLIYFKEENEVREIHSTDGKNHYGAIGMKDIEVSFASSEFIMKTDDILIIFTDGITESTNKKGEQFGISRLKSVIKENSTKNARQITDSIIESLYAFSEGNPYDDDVTLVVARRVDPSKDVTEEEFEKEPEPPLEELKPID